MADERYFPWRHAVRRPVWAIDRHWYALLAWLCEDWSVNVIDLRDDEPYVCPGCLAVAEPCAPGCIDAEIEREREAALERGDFDRMDEDIDGDDQ